MLKASSPRRASGLVLLAGLGALLCGCATYHALPLARRANLQSSLGSLDAQLPAGADGAAAPARRMDLKRPLGIDQIGLLAVLNDPALGAERGTIGLARAGLLQASLLPNPVADVLFQPAIGGPDSHAQWSATLSQDITSLVTYGARVRSARALVGQVNAQLLWQEWQVAQKARLLSLDIYWVGRTRTLSRRQLRLLDGEIAQVQSAVSAGNLDLTALSPLLAARAGVEVALNALNVLQLQNWQGLDQLLGLLPSVRFRIARPQLPALPRQLPARIARVASYRPDLIALQLGYRSSDEQLRAAILGQFPAFVLGGSWSDDNANSRSIGPEATFDLPIFDRNQGQIAIARATRLLLHEQYQSRLDDAVLAIHGLLAQTRELASELTVARRASVSAQSNSRAAQAAYAQGNIDQRTLTDYETTALQREVEVISLQRAIGEDRIALSVELGLGLPRVRIAPLDVSERP